MDVTFNMEESEWRRINRELRHHGLPNVEMLDPRDGANMGSDVVMFTSEATKNLRQTLETLVRDCDRRQELIQELIVTNNQLRDELKSQTTSSERLERQSRDLRSMLGESRSRTQDLEQELSSVSVTSMEEGHRLRNTKDAAAIRCKELLKKCQTYEDDMDRMHKKLRLLNIEDAKRRKKQEEVLGQLQRKVYKGGTTDDNVATVIDWYENQIEELNQQLELARNDDNIDQSRSSNQNNTAVSDRLSEKGSSNYKALIKSYERQLRDVKKKMKDLENEKELLKLDMESRPQLKDFRDAQARVKKLERLLKNHGVSPSSDAKSAKKSNMLFSTKIDDVEFLPVVQCRAYLTSVCSDLDIPDLSDLHPTLTKHKRAVSAFPQLEQFTKSVMSVANKNKGEQKGQVAHAAWCEKSLHRTLGVIENWATQIEANKELQESILRLAASLYPWKQLPREESPTTTQLITLTDSLQGDGDPSSAAPPVKEKNSSNVGRGRPKEQPTPEMMRGIVCHFQQLFDVPHVAGIYPRMNDIYAKLGEVHNVLKTLRDFLGLDPSCTPPVIVDAVARLVESESKHSSQKVPDRLSSEDVESLVKRLDEHDEFFPIFEDLLEKLLEILNVTRLDEVLPAVKALKLLAGC